MWCCTALACFLSWARCRLFAFSRLMPCHPQILSSLASVRYRMVFTFLVLAYPCHGKEAIKRVFCLFVVFRINWNMLLWLSGLKSINDLFLIDCQGRPFFVLYFSTVYLWLTALFCHRLWTIVLHDRIRWKVAVSRIEYAVQTAAELVLLDECV